MVPPLLKLAFVQGPRDGDSLEYKPGSTIRIGRIVRGNEIAIKDAGISTKHLRIVSDSDNWIISDLGSSNGTILNSETLDPDTPVNLRHGDVIKLGECTSLVVNFVTDAPAQENKLPPRPRRNNKRLAVADFDPDPVPVESVQEKPTRKGRSSKQEEHEVPKGTRAASRSRITKEKELEVENEKEVISRVRNNEKKVAIRDLVQEEEEEVSVVKRGNSRVRRGKNTENVQNLGLNSVKLEIEDIPKEVEISAMKRATRSSKQIESGCLGLEKVKSEDIALEEKDDDKRISRATRSRKKEIVGDSFMQLEMVLNQARKTRAKKKKIEQIPMETRNDDVEEEEDKDNEARKEDETESFDGSKSVVEQVKSTLGEEDLNCSIREDVETENVQVNTIDEEGEHHSEEADDGCDKKKAEEESSNKNVEKVKVDLEKMTLGEWFNYMEVQLRKQIVDETEKMIETMRSNTLMVHKYIAEEKQKQAAKGKGPMS